MSKLIEFYTKVLSFAGLEVDENGKIFSNIIGQKIPILVDEKEMVLPTDAQLRNPSIADKVVFHPIPESKSRGEPPVISKLLHVINIQLNMKAFLTFSSLAHIMHSPEIHKLLSPDQSKVMIQLGSLDKTGFANLNSLLRRGMKAQSSRLFTNVFLKRGGTIGERRYAKVGITSFPLLGMIDKDDEIFGMKLREKDRVSLSKIYSYVFPGAEIKDHYCRGSDSDYLPYLESLLLSSLSIATQLNLVIELFADKIDELEDAEMDFAFFDDMSKINDIIDEARRIPVQPGNVLDAPQPQIPGQAPAVHTPGMIDMSTINNQPVPPPYGYPGMYPQQPMQQPQVVVTNNGLDWNSVVQANPGILAQTQAFMGNTQQPMMVGQPRQPGWAQGYCPVPPQYGAVMYPAPMMPSPQYPGMYPQQPVIQQPQAAPTPVSNGRARF
jgi:hypothetical protein